MSDTELYDAVEENTRTLYGASSSSDLSWVEEFSTKLQANISELAVKDEQLAELYRKLGRKLVFWSLTSQNMLSLRMEAPTRLSYVLRRLEEAHDEIADIIRYATDLETQDMDQGRQEITDLQEVLRRDSEAFRNDPAQLAQIEDQIKGLQVALTGEQAVYDQMLQLMQKYTKTPKRLARKLKVVSAARFVLAGICVVLAELASTLITDRINVSTLTVSAVVAITLYVVVDFSINERMMNRFFNWLTKKAFSSSVEGVLIAAFDGIWVAFVAILGATGRLRS
jgi:predicted RND superfamily exporter protein